MISLDRKATEATDLPKIRIFQTAQMTSTLEEKKAKKNAIILNQFQIKVIYYIKS